MSLGSLHVGMLNLLRYLYDPAGWLPPALVVHPLTRVCLLVGRSVGWLVADLPYISDGQAVHEDGTALKVLLSAMLRACCGNERGNG